MSDSLEKITLSKRVEDCVTEKEKEMMIEKEKNKYIELGVFEEFRHNCIALLIPSNLKDEVDYIMYIFNGNMYKFYVFE